MKSARPTNPRLSRPRSLLVERLEDRNLPGEALGSLFLLPVSLLLESAPPREPAPEQAALARVSTTAPEATLLSRATGDNHSEDDAAAETSRSPAADTAPAPSDAPAAAVSDQAFSADLTQPVFQDLFPDSAPTPTAGPAMPEAALGAIPATSFAAVPAAPLATPLTSTTGAGLPAADTSAALASYAGLATPVATAAPQLVSRQTSLPSGYSPQQVRHAYGFDLLPTADNGKGQTIAIVDAFDDPNILADVAVFNQTFGLIRFNKGPNNPTLSVVNQTGGSTLPNPDAGWALEESLDVEWAHSIAPKANIMLVEANDNSFANLFAAAQYAGTQAHVVSMSFGGSEFSGETAYDSSTFTATGVTFVASSGDSGAPLLEYPSASPNVLSVGGTSLPLDSMGNRTGPETAWSGGGGGISRYEKEPGYQTSFHLTNLKGERGNPDVAYLADPSTGVAVYDSYQQGGWQVVGGTSVGAPQWSAIIALIDQKRATPLDTTSLTSNFAYNAAGTHHLYGQNYTDITSGSNGFNAHTGWDEATGIGSPIANKLIPYLQTH